MTTKNHNGLRPDHKVAIIGAGFNGLGMGIRLNQAGITDYIIVEKASEVGGTWRDSKYPGAAVDVPNHLYSYSFEQNPEWTRMFSKSEEIQDYILKVTDKYDLRKKIVFNTQVKEAEYDATHGWWNIQTSDGKAVTAQYVVSAIGPFAKANIPPFPGLKKFKGTAVHTAHWPDGLDLTGKRVAVVGSGASSIQVVPALAPIVKEMKVFMIEPSWVVPKADYVYSDLERLLYRYVPFVQKVRRQVIYAITELLATGIVYDTFVTTLLEKLCISQIEKHIADPELRRKLTPDYRLGKTRMLISSDYYPAMARDNVEVYDKPVEDVTENGVVSNGVEHEVDAIVWATGYKSPSEGFPFPLKGKDGQALNDLWSHGGKAYKGIAMAGFPNLFALMGPNTGPGHTSVLVYTEAQQKYIVKAIQAAASNGLQSIEIRQDKEDEFNDLLDKKMAQTTWGKGGDSWYYTKDGRNTTLYPGLAIDYVMRIQDFELNDYQGVKKGAATAASAKSNGTTATAKASAPA